MPGYTPYVIGEVFGYSVTIITNIVLIYGAMKNNRSVGRIIRRIFYFTIWFQDRFVEQGIFN